MQDPGRGVEVDVEAVDSNVWIDSIGDSLRAHVEMLDEVLF